MATKPRITYSNLDGAQPLFETTAQSFTNAWVDMGSEANVKSATGATLYLKTTVGTSTNMSVRLLGKWRSEKEAIYAQANELKARMNFHFADATEHTSGIQSAISTADCWDYTSLIALVSAEIVAYAASDADAELAATWLYHIAQESANSSLTSEVAPVTYAEAKTKLADLVAKFLVHAAQGAGTPHATGDSPPVFDAGDQEFVLPILTESSSDVKVEDEYYELNVDASQNVIIDIPLNGVVPFIQFQIKDAAGGSGTVDSAVVIYRRD